MLFFCLFDIPRGLAGLGSDFLSIRRPLGLDRERRRDGSVCKAMAELTAVLEVDVLFLSFFLSFC